MKYNLSSQLNIIIQINIENKRWNVRFKKINKIMF